MNKHTMFTHRSMLETLTNNSIHDINRSYLYCQVRCRFNLIRCLMARAVVFLLMCTYSSCDRAYDVKLEQIEQT
jgi:hypothetical protein